MPPNDLPAQSRTDADRRSAASLALPRVLAVSRWVAQQFERLPSLAAELLVGDVDRSRPDDGYAQAWAAMVGEVVDEASLRRCLRRFRTREMVRIAWRDIGGLAGLDETLADLSALADALIEAALAWLYADQCAGLGTPVDEGGEPQRLFVIGMGKLGGGELNFSSDVDLMFVYPRTGETRDGRKAMSNQEFFDRLGRRLIRALNDITEDGFVYRVDMRLRPFGEAGALTLPVAAMEAYFETHARDWERYAMIKARICAGDRVAGDALLRTLQPFVYRRYLDFGALQALREMKALINAEMEGEDLKTDIKRGPGGIREIEFIVQMFQLIRGGRVPGLRTRSTRLALAELRQQGLLPDVAVDDLLAAYRFLRNAEHRLQQIDDRQTQQLPAGDEDRARVALGMQCQDWAEFAVRLAGHRQRVQDHFARLLNGRETVAPEDNRASAFDKVWDGSLPDEQVLAALAAGGFSDPVAACGELARLRAGIDMGRLSRNGQERLARLLPMILATVAGRPNESLALARIFRLVETVARRSVYLALLAEHPRALRQLARLMAGSAFIADHIVRQPALLDELLDIRTLYAPPGAEALDRQLAVEIGKHPATDLESQMNALRHFRNAEVLKVAAADLTGHLPLPEVSNHLSWIAEAILRCALGLAWGHMVDRHGRPHCVVDGVRRPAGFAIVAFGKLGGLELGYGSDLDLIFLHDSGGDEQLTDGSRPVENSVFFTRLAQRVIHLIATQTPAGIAYEVDTRLRPSGASGLLVSSTEAYRRYQSESAWTWEHQALVRARFIAGDDNVGRAFAAIRSEVLRRPRDPAVLRREIVDMRERMRRELVSKDVAAFDPKQGEGGITDLEFMVQYGVLAKAAAHPALLGWTDNKRLLEVFSDCGLLPAPDCLALRDAYFALRAETHRCALQERPVLAGAGDFIEQRRLITRLWRRFVVDGDTGEEQR